MMKVLAPALCILLLFVSGCGKPPLQEIAETRAAVDGAVAMAEESGAQPDAARLSESLDNALEEAKAQDRKIFKNYRHAKELLAKAKTDADAFLLEQTKKQAETAMESASGAVAEARLQVSRMPENARSGPDYAGIEGDLKGIEETLNKARKSFDAKDYLRALNEAEPIRDRVAVLMEKINQSTPKTAAPAAPKPRLQRKHVSAPSQSERPARAPEPPRKPSERKPKETTLPYSPKSTW